jgi:hypothetical protein
MELRRKDQLPVPSSDCAANPMQQQANDAQAKNQSHGSSQPATIA